MRYLRAFSPWHTRAPCPEGSDAGWEWSGGWAGKGAFCCLPVSLLLARLSCNFSNHLHPEQQTVDLQPFKSDSLFAIPTDLKKKKKILLEENSPFYPSKFLPGPYRHNPLALPALTSLGPLTPLGLSQPTMTQISGASDPRFLWPVNILYIPPGQVHIPVPPRRHSKQCRIVYFSGFLYSQLYALHI